MPFSYQQVSKDKVVFTRLGARFGQSMFFGIGLLFTIIGICLIYYTDQPEMPVSFLRYLFTGFGLTAVYISFLVPKLHRRNTPDEIIFDNLNGRVEVNQQDSEVKTAYIYYDETSGFSSKAKRRQGTGSDTTTTLTDYDYHIYLDKKDGGHWELLKCGKQQEADQVLNHLQQIIDLTRPSVHIELKNIQSRKYIITKGLQQLKLTWRNKLGWGPLALVLFAFAFISVLYTIFNGFLKQEFDWFFVMIGAFMVIVFLIVMIGNVIKLIKAAGTNYEISITKSTLSYLQRDNGGRIKKEERWPFEQLNKICYSFETAEAFRKIYIYTKAQSTQEAGMKPAFSLNYIKDLYDFHKNLIVVDIQSLTPVEALYLENYLQQKIKEIGQAEVA